MSRLTRECFFALTHFNYVTKELRGSSLMLQSFMFIFCRHTKCSNFLEENSLWTFQAGKFLLQKKTFENLGKGHYILLKIIRFWFHIRLKYCLILIAEISTSYLYWIGNVRWMRFPPPPFFSKLKNFLSESLGNFSIRNMS